MRDLLVYVSGKNRRTLFIVLATFALLNLIYILGFSSVALVNGPSLTAGIGIWKFGTDQARYYVVDEEFVQINPSLRKIAKFSEDVPMGKAELTLALIEKLEKNGGELLKQIHKDVSDKYTEEYKTILRTDLEKQMQQDYTYLFYQTLQKSYTLLGELKARYLELHEAEIKQAIVYDYLKDTTDKELKAKFNEETVLKFDRQKYFKHVFDDILVKRSPRITKLTLAEVGRPINGNSFHEIIEPTYSKKWLMRKRVTLRDDQFEELQTTHDHVVRELRLIPRPPEELYSGEGIAISANGLHLPGALMLAAQLRQVGSELPIEIVLDTEKDYNRKACEEIAPKLLAKCVVTERVLGLATFEVLGKNPFQLKAVALLMSSFDHTIALDADNFVTKNVDYLLTSKPYLETSFILWPDIWHKGTSPLYYDIARYNIGEVVKRQGIDNTRQFSDYAGADHDKEIYFHDLDGTPSGRGVESGQLVFSKREHFRSLALATYYNIHKDFYYPLIYQGVHGSGDRETFVPALHVMNEPYYLCEFEVQFLGIDRPVHDKPGETFFDESTLVQRDPQESQTYARKWRTWLRSQGKDLRLYMFQRNEFTRDLVKRFKEETPESEDPSTIFLHVHMPKMNPLYNEVSTKDRYDYSSRYIRKIGDQDHRIGKADYELRIHALSQWLVCEEFTDEAFWNSYEVDRKGLCEKITDLVKSLKKDSNDLAAAELKVFDGKKHIEGKKQVV